MNNVRTLNFSAFNDFANGFATNSSAILVDDAQTVQLMHNSRNTASFVQIDNVMAAAGGQLGEIRSVLGDFVKELQGQLQASFVLAIGTATSWQVFTNTCDFSRPLHVVVATVFDEIENELSSGEARGIIQLLGKYMKAPYGMNINALTLFAFYYIAYKDKYLLCYFCDEKLAP